MPGVGVASQSERSDALSLAVVSLSYLRLIFQQSIARR